MSDRKLLVAVVFDCLTKNGHVSYSTIRLLGSFSGAQGVSQGSNIGNENCYPDFA